MSHRLNAVASVALVVAAASPLALAGCGSSSPSNDGGVPDGGLTDGGGVDGGSPDASCIGPGYGGGEVSLTVTSVSATIADPQGAAVANLLLFVTGIDLASAPGHTDATGNATLSPNLSFKAPAFLFGDALSYPRLAVPLSTASTTLASLVTAPLPANGVALTPGSTATSGDLTLKVSQATVVAIDTLNYDTPEKQKLRAVTLPVAKEADVLGSFGFEMLIGVAPAETRFCPPVEVTVPNSPGWPAGTPVEFFVSGSDTAQEWAKLASWAKASDGQVSSDGLTISTTAGQGLAILDNLAVRKTP